MKNNHINQTGDLHMIDISSKDVTTRIARARGSIILNNDAFESVVTMNNKKGDVLNTARIAGINSVKQTASLIPLAHVIPINSVIVDFEIIETENKIKDLTKATIRCIPDGEHKSGKCVFSGKPSSQRVLFAKAY